MSDYEILPLKWVSRELPNTKMRSYTADTVFSILTVEPIEDFDAFEGNGCKEVYTEQWRFRWCVDEFYDEGSETLDSMKEAKQKAKEWYLGRLLPALKAKKASHDERD